MGYVQGYTRLNQSTKQVWQAKRTSAEEEATTTQLDEEIAKAEEACRLATADLLKHKQAAADHAALVARVAHSNVATEGSVSGNNNATAHAVQAAKENSPGNSIVSTATDE